MRTRPFFSLAVTIIIGLAGITAVHAQDAAVADSATSIRNHDAASAAGLDAEVLKELDAAMQKQVDDGHVSGMIGLIARHGHTGYYEAFGQRVIESDSPMEKDTRFRLYSMTKPIVAVTAMSLWEEGKFKLDDPISEILPEWKDATVKVDGKVVPAKTPVTPRHLMTHSAGLSYDRRGLALGSEDSLHAFSQSVAKRPLLFHPGTGYRYGYSIDILGRYIEVIEGKSLDVVMRERVFDRLKMDDTEFWIRDEADRRRVAMVYTKSRTGKLKPGMPIAPVMTKPPRMMGGQGLLGTTEDYARFCQMLLNKGVLDGARVLKPATIDLMFENHLKEIGKTYGLGGMVDGKGLYFWGGAAGTKFWVNAANDSCGVFMVQFRGYDAPTYAVFRRHVDRVFLDSSE